MLFSITGYMGSGKTTICKLLAERMGFERVSGGIILREGAKEHNMSILKFTEYLLTLDELSEYDRRADERIINIAKESKGKNIIFDSRTAWHFIPNSFKIYIIVSPYEAARRTYIVRNEHEEKYDSLDEAQEALIERRVAENKRYKKVYGINCEDLNNYDVVIDTTSITPDRAVEIILECYNRKINGLNYEKLWISPESLFPTRPLKKIDMDKLQRSYKAISEHKVMKVELLRFHDGLFILDGHGVAIAYNLLKYPVINPVIVMDEDDLKKQGKDAMKNVIQVTEEDINVWAKLNGFSYNYCPRIIKKLEEE